MKNMNEEETKDMQSILRERVVRWDSRRINQFSYSNNLLIGLNLAFLGFFITQSGFKINYIGYLVIMQLCTVILLITSFVTGLLTVFNRLKDFRKTAQLTKKRKKKFEHDNNIILHSGINTINSDIENLKSETGKLGTRTWLLLNWQVWSFLIGTIIGIIYLMIDKNISG
ncbi:MAG: hypothetical protein N4A74_26140 [Carboxylicivirga sp.]|jgi:hypothetical protein|nr:hypothetical protein [Carboxylicivirga sp.]